MNTTRKSLVMAVVIIAMALAGIPTLYEMLSHGLAFKFVVLDVTRPEVILVIMVESALCAITIGRNEDLVRQHGHVLIFGVTWAALIAGLVTLMRIFGNVDINAVLTAFAAALLLALVARFLNRDVLQHRPLPRGEVKPVWQVIPRRPRPASR